jgi:predicted Rossmann fold nucleotide-binding protein DprA/Smf involved in DNA uptake
VVSGAALLIPPPMTGSFLYRRTVAVVTGGVDVIYRENASLARHEERSSRI